MIDEQAIAHWQGWIGKTEEREETLDTGSLRRFAAALGESLDVEHVLPSLAHWAFFLSVVVNSEIGEDGHPKRGGFLPPISLPRRMFAASEMEFAAPLILGQSATRFSIIKSVAHKAGRSGDLILVQVEHRIVQNNQDRVRELQTIVYRDAGVPTPAVVPREVQASDDDTIWQPSTAELFRFSAVTFNSHRIHYDLPYATKEEGYPSLVVHGPLTATKLFGHARRGRGTPHAFAFRAEAPLFFGQPVLLTGTQDGEVKALRCDDITAMSAKLKY